ncbi:unnamed protein product [Adineta steineri]|uniref:Uncharacterized protein n=1 Tax=Adineta steineri TaxID=433720 RepID=A0A818X9B5_9BILA|nr:unnamed protein product [Adineta steineri]CAF3736423.1 unnamed protein product [Adineta steineri]
MASRPHAIYNNQNAINYINKKGIDELFEAIMTALMVYKPDDHIAFIRECLDKVQNTSSRIRWDLFVSNTSNIKGALPLKPSNYRNRQKILPPVRPTNLSSKTSQSLDRKTAMKSSTLPPIDSNKKLSTHVPIMLILSASSSTQLCARLIERYNQITYLSIEDIANIDYDDSIDLKKQEHRYDSIQNAIEERRSNAQGFIISGHLEEKHFYKKWQEKLGRIDLTIVLSTDRLTVSNRNLNLVQINSKNDSDIILADIIRVADDIFPLNTFSNKNTELIESKTNSFNLPIIFCIDNHQLPIKENNHIKLGQRLSLDIEFEINNVENVEERNNSFIYTLSERIAEDFSFKHIHYGDFKEIVSRFDQLKTSIIETMSVCPGYVIDHFPTSFDDLQKFQNEIGPCAVLIYIGEHQTETKDDELNGIVEKFKAENKAIYIDCLVEVDEIYEDLKKDILKHI